MRVPNLFYRDVYSSSTGMMEACLLLNLRRFNFNTEGYKMMLEKKASDLTQPISNLTKKFGNQQNNSSPNAIPVLRNNDSLHASASISPAQRRLNGNVKRIARSSTRMTTKFDKISKKKPFIFVCPTLYRETREEMQSLMKSILRLNRDQINRRKEPVKENNGGTQIPKYDIEFNCYFDNCFDRKTENGKVLNKVNSFVDQFTDVINEVVGTVRFFEDAECKIGVPDICETPYGIKVTYDLPVRSERDKPNKFYIHLKDPMRIQKGKRWSQCMYMYYVLEHKRSQHGFTSKYDEYSTVWKCC